jgi:hypothetical protein
MRRALPPNDQRTLAGLIRSVKPLCRSNVDKAPHLSRLAWFLPRRRYVQERSTSKSAEAPLHGRHPTGTGADCRKMGRRNLQ